MTSELTHPCPAWCAGDHPTGGVHRVEVGHIDAGGGRILVVILQTPDRTPNVVISGPVYVEVHGDDHADAARLFSQLGHRDLAGLIDRAAAILLEVQP